MIVVEELFERIEQQLETTFATIASEYGSVFTRLTFVFVFLDFGAQKAVVPGGSPVREPVTVFLTAVGIPWYSQWRMEDSSLASTR